MTIELSASMMCADYACLRDEVKNLEEAGIDIFHIDIMDGSFVDNFGMGYQDMAYIKKNTTKLVEAHLMVQKPYNYLDILFNLGIDIIYVHPEVDPDPATTIEKIHKQGLIAGIAINPGTSIATIEELLNTVDRVLVLGVNPGHAGRKYLPYVDKKIQKLLKLKSEYDMSIILVSHDLDLAKKYADKVILLDKEVIKEGKPDDVFRSLEFKNRFGELI